MADGLLDLDFENEVLTNNAQDDGDNVTNRRGHPVTRRLAILDKIPARGLALKVRLAAARYCVTLHHEPASLLRHVLEGGVDLVLVQADNPATVEVIARLRAWPSGATVPLVALSPGASLTAAALRAGSDAVLPQAEATVLLQAQIRNLLQADALRREMSPPAEILASLGFAEQPQDFSAKARVALVCAGPEQAWSWQRRLRPWLEAEIAIIPWQEALDGHRPAPDAYLIAERLPGYGCGKMLMANIRSRPGQHDAAMGLVLGHPCAEAQAAALDLGADLLLREDFNGEIGALALHRPLRQKARRDHLRKSVQEGLRLAAQDSLTGLHNRRYALPALRRLSANGDCGAVLLVDLDHFKSVNDRYGHPAGDQVLVETAHRLTMALPKGTLIARYGGEEFLIALPRLPARSLYELAEHLRHTLAATPIRLSGAQIALPITGSIGMALNQGCDSAEHLIERADAALLQAKALGRNCIALAQGRAPKTALPI